MEGRQYAPKPRRGQRRLRPVETYTSCTTVECQRSTSERHLPRTPRLPDVIGATHLFTTALLDCVQSEAPRELALAERGVLQTLFERVELAL